MIYPPLSDAAVVLREKQIARIRARIKELEDDFPLPDIEDFSTLDALGEFLSDHTKETILQEISEFLGSEPIDALEWVLREIFKVTP